MEDQPIDTVIHLAAMSSPAQCEKNPCRANAVNCPIALLDLVPECNFIFLSTDQVYSGDPKLAPFKEVDPPNYSKAMYQDKCVEHAKQRLDHCIPVNVYGNSKLSFENEILARANLRSRSVILRSSI